MSRIGDIPSKVFLVLILIIFLTTDKKITCRNSSSTVNGVSGKRTVSEFQGISSDKKDLSVSSPIQFRSFQSFFRTTIPLSKSSFSIYFQLKTKLMNGLMMLAKDERQSFLFCVEVHHGKVRYIFRAENETKLLQRPLNVSDGRIHEVHIQRPSCHHNILRVDDSAGPSYTSGKSSMMAVEADDVECEIHIGGTSGYMYGVLPDVVRSSDGYIGCMSSIDLDGNPWSLVMNHTLMDEKFRDQIVYGCDDETGFKSITDFLRPENLCGCRNGGQCFGGICDCKLTSYTGPLCDQESGWFNFSHGDVIVYRFQATDKPDSEEDVVVFGLKTHRINASLVVISDEHFKNIVKISLLLGKVHVFVSINRKSSEISSTRRISDGVYHVVRFFRIGSRLTLRIDDDPPVHLTRSEHNQEEIFHKQSKIIIGGIHKGHDFGNEFIGVLTGMFVNEMFILELLNKSQSGKITIGNFSSRRNSLDQKLFTHKNLHKDKPLFSRVDSLPSYTNLNKLITSDDDIIVPIIFDNECEDFYEIPDFCERNLSDDSFVFPSYTSMRKVTWKIITTTEQNKEFCNASICHNIPSTKSSLQFRTIPINEIASVEARIFTIKAYDTSSTPDDSLIARKFYRKEEEVIQENYNYVVPDHLVSSMITNVILTVGISTSSIILVIIMLYVAKKCSKTKKTEAYVPEEINKFITHTPAQVASDHSFGNVKHQSSESYVKEWFI